MKKKLIATLMAMLIITTFNYQTIFAQDETNIAINHNEVGTQQKAELLVNTYGATSVQYALIDAGKIVSSGNAGVYSHASNTALTENTMYGIGSISKMYPAVGVMKLVDMGMIELDKPLTHYIPEFKMADERYKEITPRMLLNHSSGLMGSTMGNSMLFNDNDTYVHDNLLKKLERQRLKANPGEFSVYCNDGFTLAELLIERVSKMDFTSFIHQYIIEPLRLTHTNTPLDTFDREKLAKTYSPVGNIELPIENLNVIGTGGIYSTAEELCKFSQIFMGEETGILSKEAIKQMENPEYKNGLWVEDGDNTVGYGLGWDSVDAYPFNQYGIKALVKGGDTISFHGSLVVLPEYNMAAAVVSSGGASTYNQILASEILLEALMEKGIINEVKPVGNFGTPIQVELPEGMMNYQGIYSGGFNQLMNVGLTKEGELSLSIVGMEQAIPAQKFSYTKEGAFISQDGKSKVEIVDEKNGHTYLAIRQYATLPGIGSTVTSVYGAQKMQPHTLTEEVAKVWKQRQGKIYYIVNEKYTSIVNTVSMPIAGIMQTEALPGYIGDSKIIDENYAKNVLQIPVMAGRDLKDILFYKEGGKEYLELGDLVAISQDDIEMLYNGESVCSILGDGYTRWYKVPETLSNKSILVDLPDKGSFAVYDQNGICINSSIVTGKNTVVLPSNGSIAFMGEVGESFKINIQQDYLD